MPLFGNTRISLKQLGRAGLGGLGRAVERLLSMERPEIPASWERLAVIQDRGDRDWWQWCRRQTHDLSEGHVHLPAGFRKALPVSGLIDLNQNDR